TPTRPASRASAIHTSPAIPPHPPSPLATPYHACRDGRNRACRRRASSAPEDASRAVGSWPALATGRLLRMVDVAGDGSLEFGHLAIPFTFASGIGKPVQPVQSLAIFGFRLDDMSHAAFSYAPTTVPPF